MFRPGILQRIVRPALACQRHPAGWWLVVLAVLTAWSMPSTLCAYEFVLKNGVTLQGATGDLSSIVENPLAPKSSGGEVGTRIVRFVDNGLYRVFFSEFMVQQWREDEIASPERIRIRQPRVANVGKRVVGLTNVIGYSSFNEFGHRTFSVLTMRGPLQSVQAITEITPVYTKVEGIIGEQSVIWDMRLGTSSIPRETLQPLVESRGQPNGADGLLALVRLLIQAERYQDAAEVLRDATQKYPELSDKRNLEQDLRQRSADRLFRELQLRRDAGQHRLVEQITAQFPLDNVDAETLLRVREVAQSYAGQRDQVERIRERLGQLATEVEPLRQGTLRPMITEISEQLNYNNLARLSDFIRLADGADTTSEQQLSWALSGWLLGPGNGLDNLSVTTSLVEIRDLVRRYLTLNDPQQVGERQAILQEIKEREGGTPELVAQIVAQLRPPGAPPADDIDASGGILLHAPSSVPSTESVAYYVVLPPEYDPDRRYPLIVSLPSSGVSLQQQAAWWAGDFAEQERMRMGQSTRRGYIVVVPQWSSPNQRQYRYTIGEHAAVLDVLRDTLQKFSIDTERIFLSGHMLGGDAAWDIGVAHPDLWAGLVLIGATSDYGTEDAPKYISNYLDNARHLPMYFVMGELDGDKLTRNSRDFDRYLKSTDFSAMIVEYRGRGNEHFYEEIQRIFQWMAVQRKTPRPLEHEFNTMRVWDNFFWCLEMQGLPERTTIDPHLWGQVRSRGSADGSFNFLQRDRLTIKLPSDQATLWLDPTWVDFNQPLRLTVNGNTRSVEIRPQVEVLLEDARTRRDRQHPFWARLELPH